MKTIRITRPLRILWVVPIVTLGNQFADHATGLFFCISLALITSRMFPLSETVQIKD